jgi:hypothetical protein
VEQNSIHREGHHPDQTLVELDEGLLAGQVLLLLGLSQPVVREMNRRIPRRGFVGLFWVQRGLQLDLAIRLCVIR